MEAPEVTVKKIEAALNLTDQILENKSLGVTREGMTLETFDRVYQAVSGSVRKGREEHDPTVPKE